MGGGRLDRGNLGYLLAKASQRWNELLHERFVRAGTRGRVLRLECVDSFNQIRWFPNRSFLVPDLLARLPAERRRAARHARAYPGDPPSG